MHGRTGRGSATSDRETFLSYQNGKWLPLAVFSQTDFMTSGNRVQRRSDKRWKTPLKKNVDWSLTMMGVKQEETERGSQLGGIPRGIFQAKRLTPNADAFP